MFDTFACSHLLSSRGGDNSRFLIFSYVTEIFTISLGFFISKHKQKITGVRFINEKIIIVSKALNANNTLIIDRKSN